MSFRDAVWRLFSFIQKSKAIKSGTEVEKDIGFPFRRVKAGIKKAVTQKMLCGVVHRDSEHRIVSATINPHPKGVWTNLGDNP